jgi:hypothetical protein
LVFWSKISLFNPGSPQTFNFHTLANECWDYKHATLHLDSLPFSWGILAFLTHIPCLPKLDSLSIKILHI